MFERIAAKTWGLTDVTLVPRDQYDAILFVYTVSPPDYLTLSNNKTGESTVTPLCLSTPR